MRGDVSHPSRSSQRVKSAISRFKAWLKHRPRGTETVLDCYTEFDVDGPGTAGLCQSWRRLDDLEIIAPEGSDLAAEEIRKMLRRVRRGQLGVEDALDQLRDLPYEDLGYAKIDHHRTLRHGLPEVIFARGKSGAQVEGVVRGMLKQRHNILITRGDEPLFERIRALDQRAEFHPLSGTIAIRRDHKIRGKGKVLIVTAGTSDIPVAEEALVTAEVMGNTVQSLFDVGVAGLHRLLGESRHLHAARVIIVAAGMEGALPSVVAGLVSAPVIAVPTSVGYGASFRGLAALLGMMNSCSPNVAVVNIDNGFGAGYIASMINRL